ncbi:MAG TPA: M20/M25/M40 family metallo-hydrolase, partial [Pyrinomonadaceae bacterium]|nr:M20/M25/M40 family metallo-hydrolase [Pyrinomonadaceae bacterium]
MTDQLISQLNSAPLAKQILESFETRQNEIEAFIRALVETESPSGDENGSRAVVDLIESAARSLPCVDAVERVRVADFGQHLVVRAFQQETSAGQILIVGHTDTVHSRGSLAQFPWRRDGDRIYGPGVFDMKANCALALEVLRTLSEFDLKPRFGVAIVLTCDEEVGSASGWPLIERVARERSSKCAFVLEPPALGGRVKTGRKGTGIYAIKVEGKAAHAGLEPEKGASAILELARQIERLHAFNFSGSGITLNVGVVRGGTRSNVVAAQAEGEIDVRFATEAEAQEIDHILSTLEPLDERTRIFVSGGINRPPMERTAAVIELFEKARSIAAATGFELGEAQVGGASDGNFLAAMGIPV